MVLILDWTEVGKAEVADGMAEPEVAKVERVVDRPELEADQAAPVAVHSTLVAQTEPEKPRTRLGIAVLDLGLMDQACPTEAVPHSYWLAG